MPYLIALVPVPEARLFSWRRDELDPRFAPVQISASWRGATDLRHGHARLIQLRPEMNHKVAGARAPSGMTCSRHTAATIHSADTIIVWVVCAIIITSSLVAIPQHTSAPARPLRIC